MKVVVVVHHTNKYRCVGVLQRADHREIPNIIIFWLWIWLLVGPRQLITCLFRITIRPLITSINQLTHRYDNQEAWEQMFAIVFYRPPTIYRGSRVCLGQLVVRGLLLFCSVCHGGLRIAQWRFIFACSQSPPLSILLLSSSARLSSSPVVVFVVIIKPRIRRC